MKNIQISEEALQHLTGQNSDDWRVSAIPFESSVEDINHNRGEFEAGTAYTFMTSSGHITFRQLEGIYQVSSYTDKTGHVFSEFCEICDSCDIPYTSLGFEPLS